MARSGSSHPGGLVPVALLPGSSADPQGDLWIRPGAHRLTLAVSSDQGAATVLEDVLDEVDQAPTPRRDGWLAALAGPLQ